MDTSHDDQSVRIPHLPKCLGALAGRVPRACMLGRKNDDDVVLPFPVHLDTRHLSCDVEEKLYVLSPRNVDEFDHDAKAATVSLPASRRTYSKAMKQPSTEEVTPNPACRTHDSQHDKNTKRDVQEQRFLPRAILSDCPSWTTNTTKYRFVSSRPCCKTLAPVEELAQTSRATSHHIFYISAL